MSDDLVKRLRAAAKHPMMDNNCKADVFDVADAADRIEELERAMLDLSMYVSRGELLFIVEPATRKLMEEFDVL